MGQTARLSSVNWRKSSHSNSHGGECVEIADNIPGTIPVRDSKRPTGPTLLISALAWDDFIGSLKQVRT